ncbi:MAG TPA: hypothetical protein DCO86_03815, partial [Spirochaetaceae bacterium]|nr:hypothetical protein [Spirochaetaceae bacterium]
MLKRGTPKMGILPKEEGSPRFIQISSQPEVEIHRLPHVQANVIPVKVQRAVIQPDGTWGVELPRLIPSSNGLSGSHFRETEDGVMCVRNGEDVGPLVDGKLRIDDLVELWISDFEAQEWFELKISCKAWGQREQSLKIAKSQYKKSTPRLIREEFPELYASHASPDDWEEYLAKVAERDLPKLKHNVQALRMGWHCIRGTIDFWKGWHKYYDTCCIPKVLPMEAPEVFARGASFLQVGHGNAVILLLYVAMHLAILLFWLHRGGVEFTATFFLKGRRQLLKTAVIKVLAFVFESNRKHATTRITSTPPTIQDSVIFQRHQVVAFDDFSNSTAESARRSRENAERLVRAGGDGIFPTKRNVADFSDIIRDEVESIIVMTAEEELALAESTLARMISLPVEEDTFDGQVLQGFQSNPEILRRYCSLFIEFLKREGPIIADSAQGWFIQYRDEESRDPAFRRYASDAAVLRITADVIVKFGLICGCDMEWAETFRESANAAVTTILGQNAKATRQQKPTLRFLQAVWAIKDSSVDTAVAKNEASFFANERAYIGYTDGGLLWLNFEKVWTLVHSYHRKQGLEWLPHKMTIKESLLREGFSVGKLAGPGKSGNEYVVRAGQG